jgi:predicted protein tyrosine phosphatase
MTSRQVKQTICALADLGDHSRSGITHLLSILDPDAKEPDLYFMDPPPERLTIRFHDIILPHPDLAMPQRSHVEEILAFARTLPNGDPTHLLVHCNMGISRSTAAATAVLLQAEPELDDETALAHIAAIRPQAWPNSLMIRHADALLGRGGRLLAALGRLYRRQLEANPRFAEPLRTGGRLAEVEMAEAAG